MYISGIYSSNPNLKEEVEMVEKSQITGSLGWSKEFETYTIGGMSRKRLFSYEHF